VTAQTPRAGIRIPRSAALAVIAALAAAAGVAAQNPQQGEQPNTLPTLEKPRGLEPPASPAMRVLTPDMVPDGALVPPGPPPVLGIFGTGDVIGYLEPCG